MRGSALVVGRLRDLGQHGARRTPGLVAAGLCDPLLELSARDLGPARASTPAVRGRYEEAEARLRCSAQASGTTQSLTHSSHVQTQHVWSLRRSGVLCPDPLQSCAWRRRRAQSAVPWVGAHRASFPIFLTMSMIGGAFDNSWVRRVSGRRKGTARALVSRSTQPAKPHILFRRFGFLIGPLACICTRAFRGSHPFVQNATRHLAMRPVGVGRPCTPTRTPRSPPTVCAGITKRI